MLCLDAHSVQELRVPAAIALGRLPEDFKTEMCKHKASTCPCGELTLALVPLQWDQ